MKKFNQYLYEDLNNALVEPSSNAAAEAKKLRLQYVGFGRYEDPNTQQISHVVQNDRLVPFNKAVKSNTFKQSSQDDYGNFVKQFAPDIEQNQAYMTDYYRPEYYDENELGAVEAYTGTDFFDINNKLYDLPTGIRADQIQPEYDGDPIPAQVAALDSALNKMKTDHEFLSYVGLGTEYDITSFAPGSTF